MSRGNVAPANKTAGRARALPPYVGLPLLLVNPNKTRLEPFSKNKRKGFQNGVALGFLRPRLALWSVLVWPIKQVELGQLSGRSLAE